MQDFNHYKKFQIQFEFVLYFYKYLKMEYSVKDTNMDALISKVAAIDLGYFQDKYA